MGMTFLPDFSARYSARCLSGPNMMASASRASISFRALELVTT